MISAISDSPSFVGSVRFANALELEIGGFGRMQRCEKHADSEWKLDRRATRKTKRSCSFGGLVRG